MFNKKIVHPYVCVFCSCMCELCIFKIQSVLTIHLTLSSVALIALTVTFLGGWDGGACIVWNSLVGSEGTDGPTTFLAISRNLYKVNGIKPTTVSVIASGLDSSKIGNHVLFLAVCA